MRVTVALIAHPESPFTELAGDDWKTPYGDRRSVVVDANGASSIAAVLESAASELGLRPPEGHHFTHFSAAHARLTFYRQEDEGGVERQVWQLGELAVIDRHGHARFGVHDLRTVTVEQLVRSAQAGLLDGDPLRPYLIVEAAYGDAPPIDLATFKVALDALWDVITVVSTAGGALAFGKLVVDGVKRRLGAGRQALADTWPELPQRLHRPDQLWRIALQRPWTTDELAQVLDCDAGSAERLMQALGFEQRDDQRWVTATSDDARLLDDLYTLVNRAEKQGDAFVEALRPAVETFLSTGALSDQSSEDDDSFWGPGAARRALAQRRGEPTDDRYLRGFCRTTRRPTLEELVDVIGDVAGLEIQASIHKPRPWSRAALQDEHGSLLRVSIELDDGDPEGLFAAEMNEFADELALSFSPARHELLRFLYDVRMIATVAMSADASSETERAALALIHALASVGDGIVHEDQQGSWWQHGQLVASETPPA